MRNIYNQKKIINLWIVEDDSLQIKFLTRTFELQKYGVKCSAVFKKCEDAINALYYKEIPDILLIDISLPGISGIDGIKIIKEISPKICLIVLSAHTDKENILHAIEAGASGYIDKLTPIDELIAQIKSVYKGNSCMSLSILNTLFGYLRNQHSPQNNYELSKREKEILKMLQEGFTKKKIAENLFLSFNTIDTYIRRLYSKLEVNSKTEAVKKAILENLV